MSIFYKVSIYAINLPSDHNSAFSLFDTGATPIFSDWVQIKNLDIDQTFVINLNETHALYKWVNEPSYIKVEYYTTKESTVSRTAYYYITRYYRNATSSILIEATLDVVNTIGFESDYFTDNCNIERSHLPRWVESNEEGYMNAYIDFHQEDFSIENRYLDHSYKVEQTVTGYTGQKKWNVLYYSDPEAKTGVRTFLVPDATATMTVREPHSSAITVEADTYYILRKEDNNYRTITSGTASFTFGSTGYQYEELHIYNYGGTQRMILYTWDSNNAGANWESYQTRSTSTLNTPDGSFSSDGDMIYYINPLHKMSLVNTANHNAFPFINPTRYYNPQYTTNASRSVSGVSDLNLKNTRFIKLISIPYFPFTSTSDSSLTYRNVADDFMNVNLIEVADNVDLGKVKIYDDYEIADSKTTIPLPTATHNIAYETKFMASEYDQASFEYGAYKFITTPELYDFSLTDGTESYDIYFKNGKLTSNLLFQFLENMYDFKSEFAGETAATGLAEITSRFILSDIPNEKPLYNNEYINYIKNGYNYDKETLARQTEKGLVNFGAQTIGSILSLGVGAATGNPIAAAAGIGLISSTFQQANSIIQNQIQCEANIQKKLNQYKNSTTAVSAVNGIDLRKEYEADALYFRRYKISKTLRNYLYDFWRYYGYKVNSTGNPVTFVNSNKRYWYNYIKLSDVVFTKAFEQKYAKLSDWLELYKEKLKEGITIYHKHTGYNYDFDRTLENIENNLL